MAINIPVDQQALILDHLAQDKAGNYSLLEYYLKQILGRRNINFQINNNISIELPYNEAWELIFTWAQSEEGGLPVGDQKLSAKVGASRLLAYLQVNVLGKSREAAAAYREHLLQSAHPVPNAQAGASEVDSAFSKAMSLARDQIRAHNASVLGLRAAIGQSAFIKRFDPKTQELLRIVLSANGDSFRHYSPDMPERLAAQLLHLSGVENVNNAIHSAYSEAAESDFAPLPRKVGELEEISTIIDQYIEANPTYTADLAVIRAISKISPNLSDVDSLVSLFMPSAPQKDRDSISLSLRKVILNSARGQHVSGKDLLNLALKDAGLQAQVPNIVVESLGSYLEEIEVHSRAKLLSGETLSNDPRLLSTWGIAAKLGVNPEIPWLTPRTLDELSEKLVPGSSRNNALLQEKYNEALNSGDFQFAGQLKELLTSHRQLNIYRKELENNPLLGFREIINKIQGNRRALGQPLEQFTAKLWNGYQKIDEIVTWPARKTLELWEGIVEKAVIHIKVGTKKIDIPYLALPTFIYNGWINIQKGIALRIFVSTKRLARRGAWYSGAFRQIADFSKAFYKSDASWQMASFNFFSKKWGNVVNWAGKKTLDLANKFAPNLTAKIVSIIGISTSEVGLGLIIFAGQLAFRVGKRFFGGVKNILAKIFNGKADDLFGATSLLFGSAFLAINTMLAGIPMLIVGAITLIREALKIIWDTIVSLFILAAIVAFILVLSVSAIYHVFTTTTKLDSGVAELVANVVCDQSAQNTNNSTANVALCIAQIVTECPGLNPITENKLDGSSWQCLVKGLIFKAAVSELEHSAHVEDSRVGMGAVQCVGLSAASAAGAGATFSTGQRNACTYATINKPSGYQYLPGCPNMQAGDHFIMGVDRCGETVGHIGVVIDPAEKGQKFTCVDANFLHAGEIRGPDTCYFAKSEISGCLRKI